MVFAACAVALLHLDHGHGDGARLDLRQQPLSIRHQLGVVDLYPRIAVHGRQLEVLVSLAVFKIEALLLCTGQTCAQGQFSLLVWSPKLRHSQLCCQVQLSRSMWWRIKRFLHPTTLLPGVAKDWSSCSQNSHLTKGGLKHLGSQMKGRALRGVTQQPPFRKKGA